MKPWRKVLCLLLALPVCMALYTLLHLCGHGLAVTLLGGSITTLDPFDLTAALRYEGVVNTAVVDVAGVLFPLLVALMLLLTSPRERAFGFVTAVEGLFVWGTCLSLLMWVLLPLLGLLTPSFAKGDSAQFVLASGIPAPFVALGAALLLVMLLILSKRTGFFDPLAEEMPRLRTAAKAIPVVLTLVMTIAAMLTLFSPHRSSLRRPSAQAEPPQGSSSHPMWLRSPKTEHTPFTAKQRRIWMATSSAWRSRMRTMPLCSYTPAQRRRFAPFPSS